MSNQPMPTATVASAPARGGWWCSRGVRVAWWVALAVGFVALAWSRTYHVANEYDRYPETAELLLRGEILFDRFHPFGYPLLIAALMVAMRTGPLLSGCLVAAGAALLFVWAIGRLAERLRPGSRWFGEACAAANGVVWTFGATACSDLVATVLATLAITAIGRPVADWTCRRLAGVGLLLGAAVATRYSVAPLALWIAVWCLWRFRRWPSVAAMALGAAVGYLPNAILLVLATGSPFIADNWHNIYLKVSCDGDAERLQAAYDAGTLPSLGGFLAASGGAVVQQGLHDLWMAGAQGLPGLVLGVMWPGPWAAWWPFAVAAVLLLAMARDRPLARLLFGVALLHTGFVAFAFHADVRQVLPALPVAVLGVALGGHRLAANSRFGALVAAGLLVCLAALGATTVREHLQSEPEREVEVARSLPRQLGRPIAAFTSYGLLDRHVDYPCRVLRAASLGDREATWRGLRDRMVGCGADVLLIGRRTAPLVFAQLRLGDPPADFRLLVRDDDVCAAELRIAASTWIERLDVQPAVVRVGAACEFRVQLAADVDLARIASVGLVLAVPGGAQQMLDLQPDGARTFRRSHLPTAAGPLVVQAVVLLRDGQVLRGPQRELAVGP